MKKVIGAIVFAAVFSFSNAAHADLMESAYGNTVNIIYNGTVVVSYFFNEDGTVSLLGMDGSTADGHWTLDGTNLCVTVEDERSCNEIAPREVGDIWDETDENGNAYTVSVVAGR